MSEPLSRIFSTEEINTAQKNGISLKTARQRVRRYGWTTQQAVSILRGRKTQLVTRQQLKTAWQNGISESTVYQRLKSGLSIDLAISRPTKRKPQIKNEKFLQ